MRIVRGVLGILLAAFGACTIHDPDLPGNLVAETVAEDPTLPALEVNGTLLHLETRGDPANPVIVFVHGGPGSDYRSLTALAALSDSYFLVFYDQRGAGLSERLPPDRVSLELLFQDLDAIVDRFSPDTPVILLGQSFGGQLATWYVARRPTRVAAVVLIDPGPFTGERLAKLAIFDFSLTAEWLSDFLWTNEYLSADSQARIDYVTMTAAQGSAPGYHLSIENPEPSWRLGVVAHDAIIRDGQDANGDWDFDFTIGLDSYQGPALFIRNGLNQIHSAAFTEEQAADYPSAEIVTVEGVGHDGHWLRPTEYVAIIRDFLRAAP